MQVRKFEATSMRDAVSAVKKELGPNAVILSTKEIPPSDPSVPKLYEVTAAVSVSSKTTATKSSSKVGAVAGRRDDSRDSTHDSHSDQDSGQDLRQKLSYLNDHMVTTKQARMIEGSINDIKNLVIDLLKQQKSTGGDSPANFNLSQLLCAAGVDQSAISELMRFLASLPSSADMNQLAATNPESYIQEHAMRWMMKRIKISPKWTNTPGMTNIHVVLGTPGSGKSTLVSKIATAVSKKERHSVAVMSWDPEKLGGSEQTRIYCKILGIDHLTISRAEELKPAVMKLKGVDLLLVDTAGRNPVDTSTLIDLELIKNQDLALEFHVALSATDKPTILDRTIRHFSTVGISSLAFTKLDELPAWGDIFNSSHKWSVPVSWMSWSQSPADEPERANREYIIQQLFKNDQ